MSEKIVDVSGDDNIAIARDDNVARKGVADSGIELPISKIDRISPSVVELDEFVILLTRNGLVHDFIDHNVVDQDTSIGCAASFGGEQIKILCAVGIPAS